MNVYLCLTLGPRAGWLYHSDLLIKSVSLVLRGVPGCFVSPSRLRWLVDFADTGYHRSSIYPTIRK